MKRAVLSAFIAALHPSIYLIYSAEVVLELYLMSINLLQGLDSWSEQYSGNNVLPDDFSCSTEY